MDSLYEQAEKQLFPSGRCKINTWKNIELSNGSNIILIQAMVNTHGYIHMRKLIKHKGKIKVEFYRFNKKKELVHDDFTYVYKGEYAYDELLQEVN